MKKFVCTVCGYVYEGEAAPAECPVCHAPAEKFKEQTGDREWAAEHVVGVAQAHAVFRIACHRDDEALLAQAQDGAIDGLQANLQRFGDVALGLGTARHAVRGDKAQDKQLRVRQRALAVRKRDVIIDLSRGLSGHLSHLNPSPSIRVPMLMTPARRQGAASKTCKLNWRIKKQPAAVAPWMGTMQLAAISGPIALRHHLSMILPT